MSIGSIALVVLSDLFMTVSVDKVRYLRFCGLYRLTCGGWSSEISWTADVSQGLSTNRGEAYLTAAVGMKRGNKCTERM